MMYSSLKKIAKALIPKGLFRTLEPSLRKLVAAFYSGKNVHCPLCGHSFSKFIHLDAQNPHSDLLCPNCGSIQRKRLLWLYLKNELNIEQSSGRMLHFSPSAALEKKLTNISTLDYVTTDYESTRAQKQYDITAINEPEGAFDWIICYHVLEHIPDDKKAMSELFRILKSGGTALLQVPHREEETYENAAITTPEDRLKHFGQEDHVRWYGREGFVARLRQAGFHVREEKYSNRLSQEMVASHVLRPDEIIFVATKP